MPTGYTSKLYDKEVPFKEFVLTCARAFGALVSMREEPLDKPLPRTIKPSKYHKKEIQQLYKTLKEVKSYSADYCKQRAEEDWQKEVREAQNHLKTIRRRLFRYQKMLALVQQWQPPTKEHNPLKKFMIDQLQESINHDCDINYYMDELNKIPKLTGHQWKEDRICQIEEDISYHNQEDQAEVKRASGRNEWLQKLKASVK